MAVRNLILWVVGIWLVACSKDSANIESSKPQPLAAGKFNHLAVGTANFDKSAVRGALNVVNLTNTSIATAEMPISADAKVKWLPNSKSFWVLNRDPGDSLQIFNFPALKATEPGLKMFFPGTKTPPTVEKLNLHDLVFVSDDEVYLSYYDGPEIARYNLSTGKVSAHIDLTDYADKFDKIPEMTSFKYVGEDLWLPIQRLERRKDIWTSSDESQVLILNPKTNQVTGKIKLTGKNPFSDLTKGVGNTLYVTVPGSFADTNLSLTGIEAIDIVSKQSKGLILTGEKLVGKASQDLAIGDGMGWTTVYQSGGAMTVVQFSLDGKNVKEIAKTDSKNPFSGLAYDAERKLLFVGHGRIDQPKILVYRESGEYWFSYDTLLKPTALELIP